MMSNEDFKNIITRMHEIGWKNNFSQSSDVSTIGHWYGVSTYPHSYDRYFWQFQMLPHPYKNSYDGQNGLKKLKKNCQHI